MCDVGCQGLEATVFVWQVLPVDGLGVLAGMSDTSERVAQKQQGTIVRGREAGSGWVELVDEPGYLPLELNGEAVLKKATVPVTVPAAAADVEVHRTRAEILMPLTWRQACRRLMLRRSLCLSLAFLAGED
eukprot:SRR837773.16886.p3 GENE.SRR837773.16886~~SRR837773.16886.p3  ORF type:complete len:131 (-),score=23.10 SRR837773.16886:464-856(-)